MKKKSAKKLPFLSRFWLIFTPRFLEKLLVSKGSAGSWGFWFISNVFLTILLTGSAWLFLSPYIPNFPDKLVHQIPDNIVIQNEIGENINLKTLIRTAELELFQGALTVKNLPDPGVFIIGEDAAILSDSAQSAGYEDFLVIVDTQNQNFTEEIVTAFAGGIFLFGDKAIIRNPDDGENQIIYYSEITEPVTLSYTALKEVFTPEMTDLIFRTLFILLAVGGFIFLFIFRLISALWWGVIFWGVGEIAGIKNWSFHKSFEAALHFLFVAFLIHTPLALAFGDFFGFSFLLFALLYGMNFWHLKTKSRK